MRVVATAVLTGMLGALILVGVWVNSIDPAAGLGM